MARKITAALFLLQVYITEYNQQNLKFVNHDLYYNIRVIPYS